jgi:AcrR family transcriptional regulator
MADSAGADTRTRLLDAAALEFNEHGFSGTDTNRIARRAGFAPQTFYRWFTDKTAIFIAVYHVWEDEERAVLGALLARKASTKRLVAAVVAHHKAHRVFRRSLRRLALEDPLVRRARGDSRARQIEQIRHWQGRSAADAALLAVELFKMERLADALAEDEFEDLGLRAHAVENALAEIIDALRNP